MVPRIIVRDELRNIAGQVMEYNSKNSINLWPDNHLVRFMRAVMRLSKKNNTKTTNTSKTNNSTFIFGKDRINIRKRLLGTQTVNYISLFLINNLSLNVDEFSHSIKLATAFWKTLSMKSTENNSYWRIQLHELIESSRATVENYHQWD